MGGGTYLSNSIIIHLWHNNVKLPSHSSPQKVVYLLDMILLWPYAVGDATMALPFNNYSILPLIFTKMILNSQLSTRLCAAT